MNHGPIVFVVAWRESGSSSPRQCEHRAPVGVIEPQYGHKAAAGSVFKGEPESETAVDEVASMASRWSSLMTGPLIHRPRPLAEALPADIRDYRYAQNLHRLIWTPEVCMKFGSPRFCTLLLVIAGLPLLPACGGSGGHRFNDPENDPPAGAQTTKSGADVTPPRTDERPIATVAGDAVYADDLYAWMSELAGGTVLEELVVSRQVEKELASRGLKLEASDIDAERRNMAVATDHKLTDAELAVALRRVQQARGLGPSRFRTLIERNAGLRRLIRDEVQIGDSDVRSEIDLKYGPRTRVRIIVTPNESDAIAARARLDATAAADRSRRFAEEAALISFDPSASRGGEIEPLSAADPNYALSVRQAMTRLAPGELSPIIRLENGYALLLCEGSVAAVTPPADAEGLARTRVRLREERVAMERLARKFLQSAQVTVFDRTLDWSWNARRGQGR